MLKLCLSRFAIRSKQKCFHPFVIPSQIRCFSSPFINQISRVSHSQTFNQFQEIYNKYNNELSVNPTNAREDFIFIRKSLMDDSQLLTLTNYELKEVGKMIAILLSQPNLLNSSAELCLSLTKLASYPEVVTSFEHSDGLPFLIRLASSPSKPIQTGAVLALTNILPLMSQNSISLGLPVIQSLLQSKDVVIQRLAIECICDLASDPDTSIHLFSKNTIQKVCNLLPSIENLLPDAQILIYSSRALGLLSCNGGEEVQNLIIEEGGLQQLISLVSTEEDEEVCENSLFSIAQLLLNNKNALEYSVENLLAEEVLKVLQLSKLNFNLVRNATIVLNQIIESNPEKLKELKNENILETTLDCFKASLTSEEGDEELTPYITNLISRMMAEETNEEVKTKVLSVLAEGKKIVEENGRGELTECISDCIEGIIALN